MNERAKQLLSGYAKIKIGLLGFNGPDPTNDEFLGIPRATVMAFEEAWEAGLLPRRYELVFDPENGLPNGTAQNAINGYNRLVDQGCIVVLGAHSSDNAYAVAPVANARKVPLIGWPGTERFAGEYCFRLGNGDCGGDAELIVSWVKRKGYKSVAVLLEISPNSEEYFRFLQLSCRRHDIRIGALEITTQTPDDLSENLARLKDAKCDAFVYLGYGQLLCQGLMKEALDKIQWDPPRITTTAFMMYMFGHELFDGWVGLDQTCEDNPRTIAFRKRYEARFGEELELKDNPNWCCALHLLAYDGAQAVIEGLFRAPLLTGEGMKVGLERIRWVPTVTGGPRTHLSANPNEHNLFSGDWLTYARMENGVIKYEGLLEACD